MSDKLVKIWQIAKDNTHNAKCWQNLEGKPDCIRGRRSFFISPAHCKRPMLMRCGQLTQGGQNYWESPDGLNSAILEYIVTNWEAIWPEVLKMLEVKERKALLNCQEYIDEIQQQIDDEMSKQIDEAKDEA